jgi:uncharacterized membrane protein YjgN (DUF898 family)
MVARGDESPGSGGLMHATLEYRPSGSLAKLLLRNAALNLITLTIYRFWAKTRVRQYFWHAVRLDGEPLEYTGLGRELLIGFLIVLAVLAPATLVWSTAQTLLHADPIGLGIAQFIYFLAVYVLIHAATFRARRYRLARTRWRGIRAGQDGSTWRYIRLCLLWGLASMVTLGLAYPWMRIAQQRYLMNNTRFGDRPFSFDAPALPLLGSWLIVLMPTLLFYASLAGFFWGFWAITPEDTEASKKYFAEAFSRRGGFLAASAVFLVALGVSWLWYRLAEFRYFAAHTRLGAISVVSYARAWPILGRVILCLVVLAGFVLLMSILLTLGIWLVLSAFRDNVDAVAILPLTLLLAGLIAFLLRRFWWTLIVTTGIARHVCETLEISGIEELDSISQTVTPEQKYGEGLADSFEVAG